MRDRCEVFRNRHHAGEVLADMLESYRDSNALVLGIPSGGIPIAVVIARQLHLEMDAAIANKITPKCNSEYGYGAVAFDGTTQVNTAFVDSSGLSEQDVAEDVERTRNKVIRRDRLMRRDRPFPTCTGRPVILVDDGIATGATIEAAVEALRKVGAKELIVAVPTGHDRPLKELNGRVDTVYCPNVRGGWTFAVAQAYEHWTNMDENDAAAVLKDFYGSVGRRGSGT